MTPNAQQSTSSPISQPRSISGASHHSRALASTPRCLSSMDGGAFGRVAITMACSNPLIQMCPFTRNRMVVGRTSLCIIPARCMKEMPDTYRDLASVVGEKKKEYSRFRTPTASCVRRLRDLRLVSAPSSFRLHNAPAR